MRGRAFKLQWRQVLRASGGRGRGVIAAGTLIPAPCAPDPNEMQVQGAARGRAADPSCVICARAASRHDGWAEPQARLLLSSILGRA